MNELVGNVADGLCAMFPELIRPMLERNVRVRLRNMLQTGMDESEASRIVMEACIDDALSDPNLLMGVAEEQLARDPDIDPAAGRHSRSNYDGIVVVDDVDDDLHDSFSRSASSHSDSLDLNSTPGSSRASSPLIPQRGRMTQSGGLRAKRRSDEWSSSSNTPVESIKSEHSPETTVKRDGKEGLVTAPNLFPMDPSTSKTSFVNKDGDGKSKTFLYDDETSADEVGDYEAYIRREKRGKKRSRVAKQIRDIDDLRSLDPSRNERGDRKRTYDDVIFDGLSDSEQDLQRALEESMVDRNAEDDRIALAAVLNETENGNEPMEVGDYRETIDEGDDDDSPVSRKNIVDLADSAQDYDIDQWVKAAKLPGPATAAVVTPTRIASTAVLSPARLPGPARSKSSANNSSSILSPSRLKLPLSDKRDNTPSAFKPDKLDADLPGTSQWPDKFATAVHYAEKAAFYADKFRQSLPVSPDSKTVPKSRIKCRHTRARLLYLSDQSLKANYGLPYYIKDSFMNILDWETPHVKRSVIEKIKRMYPYRVGSGPACNWVEMIQALTHSKDTQNDRYSSCQHFEKIMNSSAVGEVPEEYLSKTVATPVSVPRTRPKFDDDLPTFTCPRKRFRSGDGLPQEGSTPSSSQPVKQEKRKSDGTTGVSLVKNELGGWKVKTDENENLRDKRIDSERPGVSGGKTDDGVERPPRPMRPKMLDFLLDTDEEWMPVGSVTADEAATTTIRSVGKTRKRPAPKPPVVDDGGVAPVEQARAPEDTMTRWLKRPDPKPLVFGDVGAAPIRIADIPLPAAKLPPAAAQPQPPAVAAIPPGAAAAPPRPPARVPIIGPAELPLPAKLPAAAAKAVLPIPFGPVVPVPPPPALPPAAPQEPQPGPAPRDQVPDARREEVVIGDGADIPMAPIITTDDKVENVLELFPDADDDYIREKLRSTGGSVHLVIEDFLDPATAAYQKRRTKVVQQAPAEEEEELDEKFESDDSLILPSDYAYRPLAEYHLTKEFKRVSLKDIRLIRKFVPRYLAARQILVDALSAAKLLDVAKRNRIAVDPITGDFPITIAYTENGLSRSFPALGHLLQSGRQTSARGVGASALIEKELKYLKKKQKRLGEKKDEVMAQKMNEDEYAGENQLIECACCYDEVVFESMVQCYEGHLFCKNCLDRYAQEAVYGQGKCSLLCMEAGCGAQFMRQTLQNALSPKMFKLYENRVQDEMVNLADLPNLVTCPKCNYKLIMDDDNNRVFECRNPSCLVKTCRDCKVDWEEHVGKKCKELEQKDETSLRTKFEEEMTKAMLRQCNHCKAQFLKSEGCNKMTCRCGHKMCYICRKPGIDYDHFCRHPRDPGKGCTSCKACSLWTSPEEDDERAIQELQKKASEERKERGFEDDKIIGAPPDKRPKKQAAQPNRPRAPHAVDHGALLNPNPYFHPALDPNIVNVPVVRWVGNHRGPHPDNL